MNKELKKLKMIKYGSELVVGMGIGFALYLHNWIGRKELTIEATEFCKKLMNK